MLLRNLLSFALLSVSFVAFAQVTPRTVPGELYVRINPDPEYYKMESPSGANGIPRPNYERRLIELGATKIEKFSKKLPEFRDYFRVRFDSSVNLDNVIASLSGDHNFIFAEKIPMGHFSGVQYIPNEPKQSEQWYFQKINMDDALWNIATTGQSNVRVAVIDGPVLLSHEDITANIYKNQDEIPGDKIDNDGNGCVDDYMGFDFAGADINNPIADANPNPAPGASASRDFHGSFVSGLICANPFNNVGIASLGAKVQLIPIKVTADNQGIDVIRGWDGLRYAIEMDAQVINISWGSAPCQTCDDLIRLAEKKHIIIVAAAGNNGNSDVDYPARDPYVLCVGSTNSNDEKSSFSAYGKALDVMAPGTNIVSCSGHGNSAYLTNMEGTSFSAPIVTSFISLLMSHFGDTKTPEEIVTAVKEGCVNIYGIPANNNYNSDPNNDSLLGYGRINVEKSWERLVQTNKVTGVHTQKSLFTVYPNPAAGKFYLPNVDAIDNSYAATVCDMQGRTILNVNLIDGSFEIPAGEGSYVLYVKKDNVVVSVQKLLVIR